MKSYLLFLVGLFLLLTSTPSYSQGVIQQFGSLIAGDVIMSQGNNRGVDGGNATVPTLPGTRPTGFGAVNSGLGFCQWDQDPGVNTVWDQICWGFNGAGGGLLAYNNIGTSSKSFTITINGTSVASFINSGVNLLGFDTATQPPANSNSNQIATTSFVNEQIGGAGVASITYEPTNAALETLATTTTTRAMRCGVFAAGDAPCLMFLASASACSISGGDIGSQVPSADSKCWIANFPPSGGDAREWGADITGTADSSTALQAMFTWAATNSKAASLPCGTIKFNTSLSIASGYNNFSIVGKGQCSLILYDGSSTTSDIILIGTPSLSTNGQNSGITLDGFRVDSSTHMTAGATLHIWHVVRSLVDPIIAGQDSTYANLWNGYWCDECDIDVVPYVSMAGAQNDVLLVNGSRYGEPWFAGYGGELRLGKGKISPSNGQTSIPAYPVSGVHFGGSVSGFSCDATDIIGNHNNLLIDDAITTDTGNQSFIIGGGCYLDSSQTSGDNVLFNDPYGPSSPHWVGGDKVARIESSVATSPGNGINIEHWLNGILQFSGPQIANDTQNGILDQDHSTFIYVGSTSKISENSQYGINVTNVGSPVSVTNTLFLNNTVGDLNSTALTSALPLYKNTAPCIPGTFGLFATTGGSSGFTYSTNTCVYELIGNSVKMRIEMVVTGIGGSSGSMTYVGLPVAANNTLSGPIGITGIFTSGYNTGFSSLSGNITGSTGNGSTFINLYQGTSTGLTPVTQGNMVSFPITLTGTVDYPR